MDGALPEPLHHIAKDLFPSFPSLPQATDWLMEEHLGLLLDLTPYMSRCAHSLRSDASMARAHHLFVSQGLAARCDRCPSSHSCHTLTRLSASAGLRSMPILTAARVIGEKEA